MHKSRRRAESRFPLQTAIQTFRIMAPVVSRGTVLKEARHKELNELVTMAEACLMACVEVEGRPPAELAGSLRNCYAALLATRLTLYSISEDRQQVRPLEAHDIRSGKFRDGGREIFFTDGRQTIVNLAVKRSALKAAIAALKRANGSRCPIPGSSP
jgi:hypothetical protein